MRSLYVPLPEDAAERLRRLASEQYRRPQEQAAVLILDGLRRHDRTRRRGNGEGGHAAEGAAG